MSNDSSFVLGGGARRALNLGGGHVHLTQQLHRLRSHKAACTHDQRWAGSRPSRKRDHLVLRNGLQDGTQEGPHRLGVRLREADRNRERA